MKILEINKYIVADSSVCSGKPTFKGTRIMVWQVLEMLESGSTHKEILSSFPSLTSEHIKGALSYAANIMRGKNYVIVTA